VWQLVQSGEASMLLAGTPGEQSPAVRFRGSASESLPVTLRICYLRILTPGCFETHHIFSSKR
jgi:hypothetical protein